MEIITRNTNTLAPTAYAKLNGRGQLMTSRNGPVRRILEPVTVCLMRPWERVHFSVARDANPFFHLIEAMAMLAPVNNIGLMAHFAKSMSQFSDDQKTQNAFYGTRARRWGIIHNDLRFTVDQVAMVIKELIEKPDTRQAVVQLWDPADLLKTTVDKACNLCMLFDIVPGEDVHGDGTTRPAKVVRMTTFNRSNDAVLGGISGANVVHLSFFHEYVALAVGIPMGSWWHVSNNLHAYVDQPQWQKVAVIDESIDMYDGVADSRMAKWDHVPLMVSRQTFDREVLNLMSRMEGNYAALEPFPVSDFTEPFLKDTVIPAFNAWQLYKLGNRATALASCEDIAAPDWQLACTRWMERRQRG